MGTSTARNIRGFVFFLLCRSIFSFVPTESRHYSTILPPTSSRLQQQLNAGLSQNSVEHGIPNEEEVSSLKTNGHQDLFQQFTKDFDNLSSLRSGRPEEDISAPVTLISAGSSYTRLWTSSTWAGHSRPPHLRYGRHILRWHLSTTARKILPTILISVAWATILSLSAHKFQCFGNLLRGSGSGTAVTTLTGPLALLLTLRANSSLGRLQEVTLHAARHLALLGWSLKAFVRGESPESEKKTFCTLLDDATSDWLVANTSRVALTARIRQLCNASIQSIASKERAMGHHPINVATPQFLIEEQIANLEAVVGGCERLFSSPIPPTYSRHLSRVMFLFLFCLPMGLSSLSLPSTILITVIASYVFVGIDEVGMEVENSFQLLPLQQLVSAAHTGVRDQMVAYRNAPPLLGEEEDEEV